MGIIRRLFCTLDDEIFPLMFKSLVRPNLEYASSVWNPYIKRQIKLLEDVQRHAAKLLPGFSELTYEERLRKLKMQTLVYRRYRGDMIETYKIMTCKYDSSVQNFLDRASTAHNTRGHQYKLRKTTSTKNIRLHSFANRVVTMWNDLQSK